MHGSGEVARGNDAPVVAEPGHDFTRRRAQEALHVRGALQDREQGAAALGRIVGAVPLEREEQREVGRAVRTRDRLAGQPPPPGNRRFALGSVGVALRAAGIADRQATGDDRDHDEECENSYAAARQAPGAAMLADVFAFELVLRDAVHRRREIRDRGAESAVAQIEICLVAREAQIEMPRLLGDRGREALRHGVTRRGDPQRGPRPTRRR